MIIGNSFRGFITSKKGARQPLLKDCTSTRNFLGMLRWFLDGALELIFPREYYHYYQLHYHSGNEFCRIL